MPPICQINSRVIESEKRLAVWSSFKHSTFRGEWMRLSYVTQIYRLQPQEFHTIGAYLWYICCLWIVTFLPFKKSGMPCLTRQWVDLWTAWDRGIDNNRRLTLHHWRLFFQLHCLNFQEILIVCFSLNVVLLFYNIIVTWRLYVIRKRNAISFKPNILNFLWVVHVLDFLLLHTFSIKKDGNN